MIIYKKNLCISKDIINWNFFSQDIRIKLFVGTEGCLGGSG